MGGCVQHEQVAADAVERVPCERFDMAFIRELIITSCLAAAMNVSAAAVSALENRSTFDDAVSRTSTDTFDDLAPNQFLSSPCV